MTAIELFEKACEAWGVTVKSSVEDLRPIKTLYFKGKSLRIRWSPEDIQDLAALHGHYPVNQFALDLLEHTVHAILRAEKNET